jgi:hypothetical protein
VRRADCKGKISIHGLGRSVGRCWTRQELVVRFDAASRCCLASDQGDGLIKRLPANDVTRERIMALAVSRLRQQRQMSWSQTSCELHGANITARDTDG